MVFNNGFPATYPQMYYPQYSQQNMQSQPQQYSIANGGIVRVRGENEARAYCVAPGNSVTFVDEDSKYIFTKTVNLGQLDKPVFERYRLVKEDDAPEAAEGPQKAAEMPTVDLSQYALKKDYDAIVAEMNALKQDIESMRGDLYGLAGKKKPKKEVTDDE